MNISLGKYKKIFWGAAFFLTAALIGLGLYFVFFSSPAISPSPDDEATPTTTSSGLPEAKEGEVQTGGQDGGRIPPEEDEEERGEEREEEGISAQPGIPSSVSDSQTLSPTLTTDGDGVQYYNKDDGKFYRVDENGNVKTLDDKVFNNVENIYWSSNKNKAVIEYPDGSNIVYDFDTREQITLPKHWEDFDFSPTGDNLVFKSIGMSPENRWLAISDDNGSQTRAIEEVGENADKVYTSWSPNNRIVAMHTQGVDFDRQKVYFIGKNNENFASITVPGRGFEPQWSKSGDKLLYSVHSEQSDLKPQLWTVNTKPGDMGAGRKSLDINTWAHKCSFATNEEIYCGVPDDLPRGSGLFEERAGNISDDIYKIDIRTGRKSLIADLDKGFDTADLNISENGKSLYFTDKNTGKLHKIELNP